MGDDHDTGVLGIGAGKTMEIARQDSQAVDVFCRQIAIGRASKLVGFGLEVGAPGNSGCQDD
ncbi:hypothetical protein D3C87_2190610 [compost metagenome]